MSVPWLRRDPVVAYALGVTGLCLGIDLLRMAAARGPKPRQPVQARGDAPWAAPPPRPAPVPGDSYGNPLFVQYGKLEVVENPGDPPPYDPVRFRDWLAVDTTHGGLRAGLIIDPAGKVVTVRPIDAGPYWGTVEYLSWYLKQWRFAPYREAGRARWVHTERAIEVPPAWGTDRRGLRYDDALPVPEARLRFSHRPAPETWARLRAGYDAERPQGGPPFRGAVRVSLHFNRDGMPIDPQPDTRDPALKRAAAVLAGHHVIEPYREQGLPRFIRTTLTLRFWPAEPTRIGTNP